MCLIGSLPWFSLSLFLVSHCVSSLCLTGTLLCVSSMYLLREGVKTVRSELYLDKSVQNYRIWDVLLSEYYDINMAAIDVDDEGVLSSIFKDNFPDTWKSNADFAQYLAELSSYGIEKLSREPERLAEERSEILEQTQDLAFQNYKTFIETAECSKNIFQDFQIIECHLESMLHKLPDLSKECQRFTKDAQDINSSRRMNNMTLQRHTQLLEILEMPQLMDTCVRNAYYEEALELAAHVKRLEKKHGSIPIIMSIVDEVKKCSQLMLNQLIQQLRTNVQLPACLKVIGYLRRMDVFSEAELRIKFLQARDAWFQSILDGIPADDAYYHITKTIEASRVHLFDIITQYRAIFSDEDPILSTRDDGPVDGALFHGWVIQKVSQFLCCLETDLQKGMGGRLDSLLGQCMYFGLSFSRVGADFRGLLAPIFQRAALASFRKAIEEADKRFDDVMQSFTFLGNPSALPSSAYSLAVQGSGSLQPPIALLEFQPLAKYCNDVLTAFNDLRLCAPLSLASDVSHLVEESLLKAGQIVIAYHRAEEATLNENEKERFGMFCKIYSEDLVPYFNRCLHHLFPPTQLSQALGLSIADLTKYGNIGVINTTKVTETIAFLVPEKPIAAAPEPEENQPAPTTAATKPTVNVTTKTAVSGPLSPVTEDIREESEEVVEEKGVLRRGLSAVVEEQEEHAADDVVTSSNPSESADIQEEVNVESGDSLVGDEQT